MSRTPPIEVIRQLRREVFFGCPVPGCGSPYLEWHHFDPPWKVRNHHDVNGMIALCSMHHPQADNGAFTVEQLRQFKLDAAANARSVEGEFSWRRNRLLAYVGGNHYLETYEILKIRERPIIWLGRDEANNLTLSMEPIIVSGEPRFIMRENVWVAHGNQEELICPPSGKLLHVKYANGDEFRVEFVEILTTDALLRRYPKGNSALAEVETPITVVEVQYRVAGTSIDFGPDYSRVFGVEITGSFAKSCGTAINIT